MVSRGPENGVPSPMNDSIDELIDGLPAEPVLPKKRAKPIDRSAPPAGHRRLEDPIRVRAASDPLDSAVANHPSSTGASAFLHSNATRQRAIVAVLMMIGVLGAYAFVRRAKEKTTAPLATTAQAASASIPATTRMTSSMTTGSALAPDAVPQAPPLDAIATPSPTPTANAAAPTTHKTSKPHADAHAQPNTPAAPPSASANTRTDVARSL